MSLSIRYIELSTGTACTREDFVAFIDAFGEFAVVSSSNVGEDNFDVDDLLKRELNRSSIENEELSLTGVALSKLVGY